jgi:SAM-dependent methyltransferase
MRRLDGTRRFGVVGRCVDQASRCAQNSLLRQARATVAAGCGRCSVPFVAVNAEQAEDWNGASGREFIEQRERHERMLGRLRARLLAAARIRDGENVLDIGCGCGETTILAARITSSGHALGTDFSRIQVAEARRLAACAGVANARFQVADAQVYPFQPGAFDVVLSSFGVMFFDDPAAAFGNLRKALRRGGRLALLCWRTRAENPIFTTGFLEATRPPRANRAVGCFLPRRHRPGGRATKWHRVRRRRVREGRRADAHRPRRR